MLLLFASVYDMKWLIFIFSVHSDVGSGNLSGEIIFNFVCTKNMFHNSSHIRMIRNLRIIHIKKHLCRLTVYLGVIIIAGVCVCVCRQKWS